MSRGRTSAGFALLEPLAAMGSEPASCGLTRVEVSSAAEGRPGAVPVGFLPPGPEEAE